MALPLQYPIAWLLAAAVAAAAGAPPVLAQTPKRASSAIAITGDGRTLLVVNPDSGSVSLVDTTTLAMLAEIGTGSEPSTIAVDDSGRRAFVANSGAGTVSVVDLGLRRVVGEAAAGCRPFGVVAAPAGDRIYVSDSGDGRILALDAATLQVVSALAVPERPSGLAISCDGATLLVTHLLHGTVSVIDLASSARAEVALWPDSNLAQSVVLSPDGSRAYLPHTRSNSSNPALTFDTTVFPIVSALDVTARTHLVGKQLNLDTLDPPGVGLPSDIAISPDGATAWVVNSASNDVTVVALATRQLIAHLEVGANPRGIVLSPDGSRAWVSNALAGTVSVIDTSARAVVATVAVTASPLPPALLRGKRHFYSSDDPRLARAQWISCNSCHFEGDHDGRTWTFGFAGPRNTTSLRGMVRTYPLRWSAEWNESADAEFAVRREQFGAGLLGFPMHDTLGPPNAGGGLDLDCLGAFIDSLAVRADCGGGSVDTAARARGERLFNDPAVGCSACHPAPYFTDQRTHDVGTAGGPLERLGPAIDTPSLLSLAGSAPYLHDGAAATLEQVLTAANPADAHGVTSHLSAAERADLVAYMLSLPSGAASCGRGEDGTAPAESRAAPGPPRPAAGTGDRVALASRALTGRVAQGPGGPSVAGALVSVRATGVSTLTGADGTFSLSAPGSASEVEVTAWFRGHYVASTRCPVPSGGLELALRRYHTADNPGYQWVDPTPDEAVPGACGNCHPAIMPQWTGNAHGGAVANPRFFSFYNGTDVGGTRTVAPGYLLDFPGTAGICATCHAPGAAVDAPFTTDMNAVRGQPLAGIHCDFCHKVAGAYLQPATTGRAEVDTEEGARYRGSAYRPYPNMPGVLSLRVLRPPAGEQIFIGPYPDIHDPDTYSPLMAESAYCAPCHEHSFWGTPIYTSYPEWLASPYSDPATGRTCQACHMPPNGDATFALPEKGGLAHPPTSIPSHLDIGVTDLTLMRHTVDLDVRARRDGGAVVVTTTLTNSGAGHHVPTDHPGRHLLLVVEARDADGATLALVEGPTVPAWGGSLAGTPGKGYAKVLRDLATGEAPVVSYWKQALVESDTRLAALASDTATFRFAAPSGRVTVAARVVFRRLFQPLAERYGWELGELTMAERRVGVPGREVARHLRR